MAEGYTFPPGPKSTSDIKIGTIHKCLLDHNEKYGKISYYKIAGRNIVSLNTTGSMREVLNSDEIIDRPLSFIQEYIFTEDILFQPSSEEWLNMREAMQIAITSIASYSEEMLAAQRFELRVLQEQLTEQTGSAFDPCGLIMKSVINGMMISLVGRRFEYDHDIFRCFKQFDDSGIALYRDTKAYFLLTFLPVLRNTPFAYRQKFRLARQAIDNLAGYLLRDSKGHDAGKQGLVYELLRIQKDDASISDEKITGTILDVYIAGILTMSATLFSLVFQLLCHPQLQKALHEEIDTVIGRSTQVTFEHLKDMPFAQAVLLEVFRQCPALTSLVPRANKKDATVCGYRVPAKTIFTPNLFGANHDANVWDDPWTFNPQRFLDENGQLISEDHPNRQNLLTFGSGKRACPFERIASSNILLNLVNLFQNHEFYHDDAQPAYDDNPMSYRRDRILYPPLFTVKIRNR